MTDVNLTIKFSNADKYEVTGNLADTVLEFKEKIASKVSVPVPQQRLIHKGKVLKDELQLETYNIQSGDTIYLVKGITTTSTSTSSTTSAMNTAPPASTNTTAPPTAPANTNPMFNPAGFGGFNPGMMPPMGGMGMGGGMPNMQNMQEQLMRNPEMMQQILNSPMMDNLLNNPELMQNMMLNNPQLQSMLNANPHIRQILSDPAIIRQTMETMRNPNAMQEMMRSQDLQMSRLENLPGGFNMLRQLYEEVQEPMMEAANSMQQQQQPSSSSPANTSSTPSSSTAPNTSALPNPWSSGGGSRPNPAMPTAGAGLGAGFNPYAGFGGAGMPGMGGMGGMGGMPGLGGMPNPAAMSAMMSNPQFQQMYQQMLNDPNMIQQVSSKLVS
jgi:ubiquilin